MWKKIKEFLDIKPPCYYEAEIQHIMFKCMQRDREIYLSNKNCIIGIGSKLGA